MASKLILNGMKSFQSMIGNMILELEELDNDKEAFAHVKNSMEGKEDEIDTFFRRIGAIAEKRQWDNS